MRAEPVIELRVESCELLSREPQATDSWLIFENRAAVSPRAVGDRPPLSGQRTSLRRFLPPGFKNARFQA
jgi:hypothetical protein